MDVQFIDELAANGRTPLHDALPWAKIAASAALLAASIAARTPLAAAAAAAAVVMFASASGNQLRHAVAMALYPVLFAGLFALGWIRSSPLFALTVVIRAFSAGLVAATLITTTPFVDVFAAVSRVTPAIVSDALFMAYRSFFILVDQLQDLLRTVRLRGGAGRSLVEQLRTYGQVLGVVILHSADMTERMYRVMIVRGYSQRIESAREWPPPRPLDYLLIAYAATVLGLVLALR
jgi:cobalt/nickel transport system permease protein